MPRVDGRHWERLSESEQRAYLLDRLADHTATLEVTDLGNGRFSAKGRGVGGFVLWLAADQLGVLAQRAISAG
jgi:hypothetical protein